MAGSLTVGKLDQLIERALQHNLAEKAGINLKPGEKITQEVDNLHRQMVSRLHRPGQPPVTVHQIDLDDIFPDQNHLADALAYGIGGARTTPTAQAPVEDPLDKFTNAELVMEMLKRGFAVMKLPEDGGPPECLR